MKDLRGVAASKGQLATVLMVQGHYGKAIALHQEARDLFEYQNEPQSVATAWHQMGRIYQEVGEYSESEHAYQRSLEIKTQTKNLAGQANTLTALGILYSESLNRPEEAITFYQQAANIHVALRDLHSEGMDRNNLADTLRKLNRYDEARSEILQAIKCKSQCGHAAQPWTSFDILHQIETATGNPATTQAAWQQARSAYLAYRQQGGYAQAYGGKLVDQVLDLIPQQKADEVASLLQQATRYADESDSFNLLLQAVTAILNGSRDPALADDPSLYYGDAAEILFLIERIEN